MNNTDNSCLKFSCPHCMTEYVVVGVDIDRLQNCLCPECRGYCDISIMNKYELIEWFSKYHGMEI